MPTIFWYNYTIYSKMINVMFEHSFHLSTKYKFGYVRIGYIGLIYLHYVCTIFGKH